MGTFTLELFRTLAGKIWDRLAPAVRETIQGQYLTSLVELLCIVPQPGTEGTDGAMATDLIDVRRSLPFSAPSHLHLDSFCPLGRH